jgi:hypothetical protein
MGVRSNRATPLVVAVSLFYLPDRRIAETYVRRDACRLPAMIVLGAGEPRDLDNRGANW